jgi:hypothetical protein
VLNCLKEAETIVPKDGKIVRALKEMVSMEIRAGPMPNLFGVIRNNTLHLDSYLFKPLNRSELLITLIHEARARAYPKSNDKENEAFAVKSVKEAFLGFEPLR